MSNPFIEKDKRNPFIEKAKRSPSDSVSISDGVARVTTYSRTSKSNAKRIAERNYHELRALLTRFLEEGNNPEAIERIRLRVAEAREAVESCR